MSHETVLIVDNEPGIRELIAFNLEEAGMRTMHAASGTKALELLRQSQFSLVILDIMMDDVNGFEVLRKMRENNIHSPVILVSARHNEFDKIQGLELGADDYVTKPFSPQELVARVQANIRRTQQMYDPLSLNRVECGGYRLEPSLQTVYKHAEPILLTTTDTLLLSALMKQPDRPIAKADLFRQVWGRYHYDDNTLNVAINRLRFKIEDDPRNPRILRTIWGLGYVFSREALQP